MHLADIGKIYEESIIHFRSLLMELVTNFEVENHLMAQKVQQSILQ